MASFSKKFEYLRENEFFRKTILAYLSRAQMGSIYEKKLRSKISWHSPFKSAKNSSSFINETFPAMLQTINMYFIILRERSSTNSMPMHWETGTTQHWWLVNIVAGNVRAIGSDSASWYPVNTVVGEWLYV